MRLTDHPSLQTNKTDLLLYLVIFTGTVAYIALTKTPGWLDSDAQWHIAAGKLLLETGHIPIMDPWGVDPEQKWYNLSWLFDILLGAIDKTLGDQGLQVLSLILPALLLSEVFRNLKAWTPCPQARLLAVLVVAGGIQTLLALRPQTLSGFFVLYTLTLLQKSREDPKNLRWLPILALLWANTHGGFPLLFLLIGAYFIAIVFQKKDRILGQKLLLWGSLSAACCLLNPWGPEIIIGIQRTTNSCITPMIVEWQPWGVRSRAGLVFLFACLATILFLPNKTPLPERILSYLLFILAIGSLRHFGLLAIIAAPLLALQLSQLPKLLPPGGTPIFLCLSLFAGMFGLYTHRAKIYQNLAEAQTPYFFDTQSIDHLRLAHSGKRVLNSYSVGGVLTRLGGGVLPHFIDGRAGTAFPEERLQEYINVSEEKTPLVALLKKYQFQVALLERGGWKTPVYIQQLLQEGWVVEHSNPRNLILTPTDPPQQTPKKGKTKKKNLREKQDA